MVEMKGFQQIRKELAALGAHVVGVSTDTWASQGAFAEKNGIDFPLLSDWPDYRTIAAFGVVREGSSVATRSTFVFDTDGVVQAVIDDQRNVQVHPDGALEAVKRLVKEI